MLRKMLKVALVGAFGLMAVVLAESATVRAQDKDKKEEKKTTKQIMSAAHKGDDALAAKVTLAVQDAKWEDAQKFAKQLAAGGALLPKATPPRGDAKSWETLSTKYAENTKALFEATDKKDTDTAKAGLETINGSCKACHMSHKGKK